MHAYWSEEKDLGDDEVLLDLAAEAGLDRDDAAETIAEGRYADRIVASTQDANRLGISAIPAFVLDRRLLVLGAQPEEAFEQAVAQLHDAPPPSRLTPVPTRGILGLEAGSTGREGPWNTTARRATTSSVRGCSRESRGGRERTLAASVEAATPPFRFTRLGSKGARLSDAALERGRRCDDERRAPARVADPGRLHLPRPVRRPRLDVRQDDGRASASRITPAQLVQARSPSLDLDSLYGAGPRGSGSPSSTRTTPISRWGKTVAIGPDEARQGFDLPQAHGDCCEKRRAVIPDPRNDENLAVAQTHLAPHPLPQPCRRQGAVVGAPGPAVRQGQGTRRQALPVDSATTTCPGSATAASCATCSRTGARCSRWCGADRRPDDADRVLGRRVPARAQHGAGRVQLEQAFYFGTGFLDFLFDFSGLSGNLGAIRGCRATGSPTFAASTTSPRPIAMI